MKLHFLGAVRTVTGSMHIVEVNGHRLLLDCGLFQGKRAESFARNSRLPFDARSVDRMILSHAHIDHSGSIPVLARAGFDGDIMCTSATRDLCAVMLRDSGKIQEADAEHMTRQHAKKGLPPIEPIYTLDDVESSLRLFVGYGYRRPVKVMPGVTATFFDAGHILGAAVTVLDIEEDSHSRRLVFTGDLGRRNLPILRDPDVIADAEYLITESTYGNRLHGNIQLVEEQLQQVIRETVRKGGKLLIPAFAVERTQEIVYAMHRLLESGRIPNLPVYVDSPLALDATEIFRLHPEVFDQETREFIRRREDPFGFHRLTYIRDVEESKRLNTMQGPMVIVAASGMCEAGRILHHLKNNVEDPLTTVLIVSWQAPNTLGRRLVEMERKVRIFGEEYTRRADVKVIDGLSAHADRDELLWWIGASREHLKGVFVVHGEPVASEALAASVRELGVPRVEVPEPGQVFEV